MLIPITLFGWIPAVLLMFTLMQPRRAVIAAYLGASLFLPIAGYDLQGLPAYTKMTAATLGVILGVLIFDAKRLFAFRPHWLDLPMVIWCLAPIATSLSNGLGLYDGLTGSFGSILTSGLPYTFGRLYFSNWQGVRELATGIFVAGLIYMPLCLYEIRMYPVLHDFVYGYAQKSAITVLRMGGYRPRVFMNDGLMVGLWMAIATMSGMWLWISGSLKRLWTVPMVWLVWPMVVTTVLCKALTASSVLLMGMMVLFFTKWCRSSLAVIMILAIPPVYMATQSFNPWSGEPVASLVNHYISPERSDSFVYRLWKEKVFIGRAFERPIFGWGGWGRMNPQDPRGGDDILGVDGMWYIVLGNKGLVGLVSFTAVYLLAPIILTTKCRPRLWVDPHWGCAGAIVMVLVLFMLDSLLNAMPNSIYTVSAGAIVSLLLAPLAWAPASRTQPRSLLTKNSFRRRSGSGQQLRLDTSH